MQNYNLKFKNFTFFIVILSFTFLILNLSAANAAAPTITSVYPSSGSTNVSQRPTITAYFDKDIDPTTINGNNFNLKNESGMTIEGEESYSLSEKKAFLKPYGNLAYDNKYIVTITTGVKDLAGNHLASDYVWSFRTTKGTDLPTSTLGCDRPIWEWEKLGLMLDEKTGECVKKPIEEEKPKEEEKPIVLPPTGDGATGGAEGTDTGGTSTEGGTYTSPKSGIKSIVPCGWGTLPKCEICHLFMSVNNIIKFLSIDIAMPLGVIVLIYGGVMILTSGGSEEKLKKGKQALWFTLWGLVIVFAGVLIIDTIIKALVSGGFKFPFGPWNAIPSC
ncbi:MAG: Ig-like domain-containing protein [Candidatus Terrybacteria bacterium]|nr:Ig-like domain-containing protein [Candidatus Terrybacteria bacterium]